MTLVLPQAPPKRPSLGQRLSAGVGQGLQVGEQLMQQHNQEKALSRFPELAGLPPDLQKVAFSEMMKLQGKEKLLSQKQKMFGDVFGQNGKNESSLGNKISGQENTSEQFDPSTIPDEKILELSAIDPQLGSTARQLKDTALREKREGKRLELAEKKTTPEFQRQQHLESSQAQADVKYNQQVQENSKQLELKETSLDRLQKLNKKGVTGKPWEKLAEKAGLINITSEGRREFAAEVKNLITDIRSILGSQFSQFEFQTILNAYPSADFSKEANAAIIKNQKEFVEIKKKEKEVADQLKKENGGKLPYDFQSLVNEKVHEYASSRLPEIKENTRKIMNEEYGIPKGHTLMFDQNDEPLSVPNEEIDRYIELGAFLP